MNSPIKKVMQMFAKIAYKRGIECSKFCIAKRHVSIERTRKSKKEEKKMTKSKKVLSALLCAGCITMAGMNVMAADYSASKTQTIGTSVGSAKDNS